MATPYQISRSVEYKCLNELKEQGYYSWRSAGSHSIVDVTSIDLNSIRLIQVKSKKTGAFAKRSYKDENVNKLIELPVPANCRKELWQWLKNKGQWRKDVLTEY